jgi:putative aldouronate transport system substrate-binding protein
MNKRFTRRYFLRMSALSAGATVLAACTPATTPMAEPTAMEAAVTQPPAAPPSVVKLPWERGIDPGSPNNPKGWEALMPDIPSGLSPNKPVSVQTSLQAWGADVAIEGDTEDNTPFTRMIKKHLGIEWKVTGDRGYTYADYNDRDTKLNLAMVSNNLPDFIDQPRHDQWEQLLAAGMIEDITDAWNEVVSERIKKNLEYDNRIAWSYADVDGRIMGIPYTQLIAQNNKVLWIRQDWLDQVGMNAPVTLEDVGIVAKAFVENDLGMGAQGTTVGLLACTDIDNWYASLDPILGAYGVATSAMGNLTDPWVKTENGSLAYSPIYASEGMKRALTLLAQWYKDGLINADFDIKRPWEVQPLVESNQTGMHFTPYFAANWGLPGSMVNDPKARWTFVDLPTGPGGRQGCHDSIWSGGVFAFRKGYPYVKEILQMMNWMDEYWADPGRRLVPGWEGWNYHFKADGILEPGPGQALEPHAYFLGPVGPGGACSDIFREYNRLKMVQSWKDLSVDKLDAYQSYVLNDPNGTGALARDAYLHVVEKSPIYGIKNWFLGKPTATMTEKGADLYAKETALINAIIKGEKDATEWDIFVAEWKAKGGDQITVEVNDWWASRS